MSLKQEHTLGWIGLQLAEKQRQVEQGQQLQIDQERREQNSKSQDMGMQMTQHAIDAEDRQYERKLQLANLLQKTALGASAKTDSSAMADATKRRGQDLTNEDRDLMRQLKEGQDKIQNSLAGRKQDEVERHNPIAEGNAATGNMVQYAGQQNSQTGAPRNQVVESNPETGMPTRVAPSNAVPPGATPMSKTTRGAEEKEVAGMADVAPYFTRLIQRLKQPESKQYFGGEEGGIAIPKEVPLLGGIHLPGLNVRHGLASFGIGSKEDLDKAKGYNEIKQMMTDLENARVLEQSGKVVNQEELGRVQEALGRIRNAPFSNKIEVMVPALEQAYESLRSGYARKNQQLQQGYLPGTLPAADDSGGTPTYVPDKALMDRARQDPVVSQKISQKLARLPASYTPEQKARVAEAMAKQLLGQQAAP